MYAHELVTFEIPALKISDSVGQALDIMEEFKCVALPVVHEGQFLGTLAEELLQSFDVSESISTIPMKDADAFVLADSTLVQVVDYLLEKELDLVVVSNEAGVYQGFIYAAEAYKELVKQLYSGSGAVVELKLNQKDYSLSEISRIVEDEGVSILKLFVMKGEVKDESQDYTILLKFNKDEIASVISGLKRFGYAVTTHSSDLEYNDLDRDRYEQLMKYLNV